MNVMTDPVVPTDVRMLGAADNANAAPQGGTAASRAVIANPYLRHRVIEPPAPPRQATIGMSGNIVVPSRKTPTKRKERTQHGGSRNNSGRKIANQTHGPFHAAGSIENAYGIRATLHAQEPIEQPLVEEDTVPTATVNRDVLREEDTPSWHGEVGVQRFADGSTTYEFRRGKHRKRMGLAKEAMVGIDQERASCNVRLGILMEQPRAVLYCHPVNLKDSWKLFHQLKQFNWLVVEQMPPGWMPKCGSCGYFADMRKHGKSSPPRLVYEAFENYVLNAPERFYCRGCAKLRKNQRISGVPKKDLVQYSWTSTSKEILEQLRLEHMDVYLRFPCFLTKRAGIDNELLISICNDAVKGIGPAAKHDVLERQHCERWQEKEVMWLAHLKSRVKEPLNTIHHTDPPFVNSEIEICPHYFSDEIGGVVPSSSWLIEVFCAKMISLRQYFDAEVIKRLVSSEFISLDASYKVPNWIMRWGGEKLFEVLESGKNEYSEVILQHFASSDNHRQLEMVLEALKECGLRPKFASTDVPNRDKVLLEKVFESLRENVKESDTSEDTGGLDILPIDGEVICPRSLQAMIDALNVLDDALKEESDPEYKVLGMDFEWPLYDGGRVKGIE
eukprot:scaffold78540_cov53-Attheya_sp.AAC.1